MITLQSSPNLTFEQFYTLTVTARQHFGGDAVTALRQATENEMIGCLSAHPQATVTRFQQLQLAQTVAEKFCEYPRNCHPATTFQAIMSRLPN